MVVRSSLFVVAALAGCSPFVVATSTPDGSTPDGSTADGGTEAPADASETAADATASGCADGSVSCTVGKAARCVDLKSDPNSCGSCERACGIAGDVGTCREGQCVAKVLTTLVDTSGSLMLNASGNIFFHDQKRIYRCDAPDCANRAQLYTGTFEALPLAQGMALATTGKISLYFVGKQSGSSITSLARCDLTGCVDPEIYISNLPSLALFGSTNAVYSFDGQRLYSVGLAANSTLASRVEVARYKSPPDRFALTTDFIFAASSTSGVTRAARTACSNPDISPCEAAVFVDPSLARPTAIDARNDIVYFNDTTSGRILSCPAAGCANPATTVATGQPSVESLFTDGSTVAWTYRSANALTDEVRECTLISGVCSSSKTYVIASKQHGATQVRLWGSSMAFWLSAGADDSDAGATAAIRRTYFPKP
jgi:hypothetical protein